MQKAILLGSLVMLLFIGAAGCSEDRGATMEHNFRVERVIDGDTIVLVGGQTVRYIGMDTPEKGEPYYDKAKDANCRLVEGKDIELELDEEEKDRYGRTLAYVYVGDTFVNLDLVKHGYAQIYPYPPNVKYQEAFLHAQEDAREKRLGIWSSRPQGSGIEITETCFDPPGDDRNNLNGEWVMIANNTDAPVDMAGFTLSDDSGHVYRFGDFTLSAGGKVKVFTGSGTNTSTSLYWEFGTPIWNNDGDTACLEDSSGNIIDWLMDKSRS